MRARKPIKHHRQFDGRATIGEIVTLLATARGADIEVIQDQPAHFYERAAVQWHYGETRCRLSFYKLSRVYFRRWEDNEFEPYMRYCELSDSERARLAKALAELGVDLGDAQAVPDRSAARRCRACGGGPA